MVVGVVLEIAKAPVAVGEVERAASIAPVDGADCLHLCIGQREVEDADVFEDVGRIGGTGNGAETLLHVPAEDNLIRGLTMSLGYLLDGRVVGVVAVVVQRIPALHLNVVVLCVQLAGFLALGQWVTLYLRHLRLDLRILHDIVERLHTVVEVADAEGTDAASLVFLLHHAPAGKDVSQCACGMVDIHEVEVIDLQSFDHSVEGILRISQIARNLACHPNLLAGYATFPDAPSCTALVVVEHGIVQMAVA